MNAASAMDHGLRVLESWPIPIFFNRKGKISGREVAPMESPARQTRHKIRPIVFPESSGEGGFHREATYISPTRRNMETVFELSPSLEQIFRHIRWAETNFKAFPPSFNYRYQ